MAHGGPSGTIWPDQTTLSSETSLNIPTQMTMARNDGGGGSQGDHRHGTYENSTGDKHQAAGGADGGHVASSNGPSSAMDTETEAVDPEAIYGQLFADFVQSLDEFTPTIPDAVTSYYMSSAGFQVDDPRLLRLISLSCQKFIADVTNDAMQHCKIRMAHQLKNQKQTKPRFQLTLDDLLPTLKERGINIKKPHYFI